MEKNRKIRRKWKMVVAIVFVLAVMIGIGLEGEERSVEGEPDVISSMIVNNEQYLTVVANRNEIEKEEEFKKLLIRMYEENSFHSVKFSTDISDPETVYMKVYPFRETIKEKETDPILEFKYNRLFIKEFMVSDLYNDIFRWYRYLVCGITVK